MSNRYSHLKRLHAAAWIAIATMVSVSPAVFAETTSSSEAPFRWMGPEEQPLPFIRDEDILDFLRKAEVVKFKEIPSGKNRPLKVTLEKDGITAHAVFRTVDKKLAHTRIYGKNYRDFHDSYRYECAAYEMGRILGLDTVPPCVPRVLFDKEGSLQLWVENAKTLKQLAKEDSELVKTLKWVRQRQTMRLFDALIYNYDRNTGNMLIDEQGKLWFIDHTRSFLGSRKIEDIDNITWCERGIWQKLKALDEDTLSEKLYPHINYARLKTLLKRRDMLVEHIETLIAQRGEDAVIYDRDVIVMADAADSQP